VRVHRLLQGVPIEEERQFPALMLVCPKPVSPTSIATSFGHLLARLDWDIDLDAGIGTTQTATGQPAR